MGPPVSRLADSSAAAVPVASAHQAEKLLGRARHHLELREQLVCKRAQRGILLAGLDSPAAGRRARVQLATVACGRAVRSAVPSC